MEQWQREALKEMGITDDEIDALEAKALADTEKAVGDGWLIAHKAGAELASESARVLMAAITRLVKPYRGREEPRKRDGKGGAADVLLGTIERAVAAFFARR